MILVIDTKNEQYYIQLKGLARADVIKDDKEIFIVRLKFFFLKFYIHPLKAKKERKSEKSRAVKVDKKTKKLSFRTVIRIIKSFKVIKTHNVFGVAMAHVRIWAHIRSE